jgi:hypothetical protein
MTETIEDWKSDDVIALMSRAQAEGRTGTARKTKLVDARPAHVGEIVVTAIKGEGKETQSPPAKKGDWVVRNRCPETGNEQYLVTADRFTDRYRMTGSPVSAHGWREYRPVGRAVRFHILPKDTAPFRSSLPGASRWASGTRSCRTRRTKGRLSRRRVVVPAPTVVGASASHSERAPHHGGHAGQRSRTCSPAGCLRHRKAVAVSGTSRARATPVAKWSRRRRLARRQMVRPCSRSSSHHECSWEVSLGSALDVRI